jgi:hypothetical protein
MPLRVKHKPADMQAFLCFVGMIIDLKHEISFLSWFYVSPDRNDYLTWYFFHCY